MAFPGIKIEVTNGNLQQAIGVSDGTPCLAATATQAGNINVLQRVYNLQEAEQKGYTEAKEPFIWGLIKEFYQELGGNKLLYVYGTAETATMADVLNATKADGVKRALTESSGEINLVAVARKPASGYNAGTGFLDADVAAAVTMSKTLAQAQQAANTPIRIFIEGRVANATANNTYQPKQQTNGYAAVVLGGTKTDGSAAVGLCLARAVKYPAHIKLGNGQNGSLSVNQLYIGNVPFEKRNDMETLHDAGFLTFHSRPGTGGYYFGVDNMCAVDDYRILAHGRVMDKAQRVAARAYLPYLENSISVKDFETVKTNYEKILETALRTEMGGQMSDVKVSISTNQDIVNTSTLNVDIQVLPLGYLTWINIKMGLTAKIV